MHLAAKAYSVSQKSTPPLKLFAVLSLLEWKRRFQWRNQGGIQGGLECPFQSEKMGVKSINQSWDSGRLHFVRFRMIVPQNPGYATYANLRYNCFGIFIPTYLPHYAYAYVNNDSCFSKQLNIAPFAPSCTCCCLICLLPTGQAKVQSGKSAQFHFRFLQCESKK